MRNRRWLYWWGVAYSERLAKVSYEARWLWVLLVACQDDEGQYPWNAMMVRVLIVGTEWTARQADQCRDELVRAGLARMERGMLVLYRGAELNGTPKSAATRGKLATTLGPYSIRIPGEAEEGKRRQEKRVPLDVSKGSANATQGALVGQIGAPTVWIE